MSHKYDDLISQPHHTSSKRPRMPTHDRAAQFAPFAALTGYQEVIGETSRLTTEKVELGDDLKEELNQKLQQLSDMLDQQPAVTLTYFQPDERKEGGTYQAITGIIQKIDGRHGIITFANGIIIPISDVFSLSTKWI